MAVKRSVVEKPVAEGHGGGHRQRQAEETRLQIARAARSLFAERGYAATTIAAIAEEADIPAPTIYSAFGSKAKILEKITRIWMTDAQTVSIAEASLAEPDPAEQLRMFAELNRRQLEVGSDVVAIYQEAARSDPQMAAGHTGARSDPRDSSQPPRDDRPWAGPGGPEGSFGVPSR